MHALACKKWIECEHSLRSIFIVYCKKAASYFKRIRGYIAEDETKELSSHTVGTILHIFYVH